MNNGKGRKINLDKTQLDRLEKLGVFARQIDSTIEEKIDAMIEWNKKYPMMRLDEEHDFMPRYASDSSLEYDEKLLRIYDESELTIDERYDRLKNISERFKKLQGYYQYVKQRKYSGKLTEEQISRCKEGNVRGVFGYPDNTEKMSDDYNFNIDMLDFILSRYETINNYLLEENLGWSDYRRDFFEVNLSNDDGIERLISAVQGFRGRTIYNRDVILEQLNGIELSQNRETSEKRRKALMEYYGINEKKRKSSKDIAEEMGVSSATIHNYINKALETLRVHHKDFDLTHIPNFDNINEEDRKKIVDSLGNYAFGKPDKYNIDNLDELVYICKTIEKYGTTSISNEEKEKIELDAQVKDLQQQIEVSNIPIEQLDLTARSYNGLVRAGIKTVQDIIDKDKEYEGYGLGKIRNLGKNSINEIRGKIEIYRKILEGDSTERDQVETIYDKGKQTEQSRVKRALDAKEEYEKIIAEKEQNDEGRISDSSTPQEEAKRIEDEEKKSELELLREKRDKLLEKQRRIQEKIAQAKELSASYDRLNGNLQENEVQNLSDE